MINSCSDFLKKEMPALEKFFSQISNILVQFSNKHNLLIEKYNHAPAWSLKFAHPEGGEASVVIAKSKDDMLEVHGFWFIDSYKEFKRYIKLSSKTYLPITKKKLLKRFLEHKFSIALQWKKGNWTSISGGYEKIWPSQMKEGFNKKELPQPKNMVKTYKEDTDDSKIVVVCKHCSHENIFNQPYVYHAGFGDQGFLYNDEGNLTLIWGSYDKTYSKLFPRTHPWMLTLSQRKEVENMLSPAPRGGKWRFKNPARCLNCKMPIMGPIFKDICYLKYSGSLDAEKLKDGFSAVLKLKRSRPFRRF